MTLLRQIIYRPSWSVLHRLGSNIRPHGRVNAKLISSLGEKLITIQFGSLGPVVVLIESKRPLIETDLFVDVSDKADDDEKG